MSGGTCAVTANVNHTYDRRGIFRRALGICAGKRLLLCFMAAQLLSLRYNIRLIEMRDTGERLVKACSYINCTLIERS